jgi:hypothetical protein
MPLGLGRIAHGVSEGFDWSSLASKTPAVSRKGSTSFNPQRMMRSACLVWRDPAPSWPDKLFTAPARNRIGPVTASSSRVWQGSLSSTPCCHPQVRCDTSARADVRSGTPTFAQPRASAAVVRTIALTCQPVRTRRSRWRHFAAAAWLGRHVAGRGEQLRGRRPVAWLRLSGFSSAMVAVPASTSSLLWPTSDGPGGGEVAAAFGRFRTSVRGGDLSERLSDATVRPKCRRSTAQVSSPGGICWGEHLLRLEVR